MSIDASELKRLNTAQQNADAQDAPAKDTRIERVYKMFTPAERIHAIKAERIMVQIGGAGGGEAMDITIRPLSPKQFVEAFQLIREVLVPIMGLYSPGAATPGFADLLAVLGERIDKIPELVWFIIKRGNNIEQAWVDNNMDLGLDLQLILPPFIVQNGLERILGGTDAPSQAVNVGASTVTAASNEVPTTEVSPLSSSSSADTTVGQATTPGTN